MAKATRAAFGETLIKLVDEGMDIMAVDADLCGSTTTAKFGAAYPDRLFDVGIAEQNMIGVARAWRSPGARCLPARLRCSAPDVAGSRSATPCAIPVST